VPALALAGLVCLGWRRAAAAFAAFIPVTYLGIALTSGFTLLAGPRGDVTLYAYALEALILLVAPGAARGWRALRWRPSALLAAATVAAGVGMNGGFWPLLHRRPVLQLGGLIQDHGLFRVRAASAPQGIIGFIDRLFGIGPGNGWGDWLVYQGTLMAVIVAALVIMLASSPVNRRVLFLLGNPFALGAVIYLCSLINPPPSGPAGNALAASRCC
jgi:hypothetical protein